MSALDSPFVPLGTADQKGPEAAGSKRQLLFIPWARCGGCALVLALLLGPTSLGRTVYGSVFRTIAGRLSEGVSAELVVRFVAIPVQSPRWFDTEIWLARRSEISADGQAPTRVIQLDSRAIGWVPTALTFALVWVTPMPWRRRLSALALSITLVQIFVGMTLVVCVFHQLADSGGAMASGIPWVVLKVLRGVNTTLFTHFGAGLLMSILAWGFVCCILHPPASLLFPVDPGRERFRMG